MSQDSPFTPDYGNNKVLTLTAATNSQQLLGKDSKQVRVANTGATNRLYFRLYNAANAVVTASVGVASSADCGVAPGQTLVVTRDTAQPHDSIALISTAGTTAEVITGNGRP